LSENSTAGAGYSIKSGTKNNGWKVTITKGGDATSNYSRELYTIKPCQYSVRAESLNWLSNGYGTLGQGILRLENSTTAIDARAVASLRNKLQGKVGNAQLAAPVAESREIHRLVRQINDLGMDTLKAMLAAKQSKGKSVSKLAGNIWLGFGFGVNPLLKDIQSAADSILHYVTRRDSRIRISGTANQEYVSGQAPIASSEFVAQDCAITWHKIAKHEQGIRYVAGIDLQVRSSANYGVTDHLGLELGALPSTLWELTPFSWVVDYGSTVGEWLEDMFYTVPGTVKYVSKNYKYQCVTTSIPQPIFTLGTTGSLAGSNSEAKYTLFTRTQLAPTLPVRPLRIRTADEVAKHGLNKMLNLAGVLAGRRGPNLK
jgi:hypothetical protein